MVRTWFEIASERAHSLLTDQQYNVPMSHILLFIFTILLFLLFISLLFRMNGTQMARVNWPVIGMFAGVLANSRRLPDFLTDVLRESGGTIIFKGPWFSGMNFMVTCDPANVNHMFNRHNANYPRGEELREMFDVLGEGLLTIDDDLWKHQRRMANARIHGPQFRSSVAKWSREKVENALLPLLFGMEKSDCVVNLHDVFRRYAFDFTCLLVIGMDPCSLAPSFPTIPFANAVEDVEEALFLRHTVPKFWWKLQNKLGIGAEKRMKMAREVIDQFITERITERREDQQRNLRHVDQDGTPSDLLSLYMDLELDDPNHLESNDMEYLKSDKFLRDTIMTFLSAGKETTGAALSWFFYQLSTNPVAEKKILEELREVRAKLCKEKCSSTWTVFDEEEIGGLVYLHAALCESMRLYPPIALTRRNALKEEVLPSGDTVKSGMMIIYAIYSMGRMEEIWGKDCLEFKPERWITCDGKLKHEPAYKFFVFFCGPHSCVGKNMAFTQMKITAAAVLFNFRIEAQQGHVVEPKLHITTQMKKGLMVKVRKREEMEA